MKRAAAMNIANKSSSEKTILNIQKIDQVIAMWRKIKYLTVTSTRINLKTIDILTDTSVQWNDIKSTKNIHFKIIDDPILIDQLIADRNANHLNQVDGTLFTIESFLSLVGKDTFTTFSQELLDGTADLSQLKLSPTPQLYMQNLKQKNTIVKSPTNTTISYKKYVEGFKKWKKKQRYHLLEDT